MSVAEIAKQFTQLCQANRHEEAGETFWADDVVSIEAMDGPMARLVGKDAVRKKSEWWAASYEVHGGSTVGPFVNGDQFAVRFAMDVTNKETRERINMEEVGVYTVKGGKIVEERFFY